MKKILFSAGVIVFVSAVAYGATGAFFSDAETSTGNVFTAGAIDLKIDNTSYYNGIANTETTWVLRDLTVEKFFNFTDIKPGDNGEDTISLHIDNNPSWVCAEIDITKNDDVTSTEPELEAGDVANTDSIFDGELAQNLNFVWWADDGDNVLEQNEADRINAGGGLMGSLDYLANTEQTPYLGLSNDNKILLTLSDSQSNFFNPGVIAPLTGDQTYYIGKAFCFGTLTLTPVATGAGQSPIQDPGVTCNGESVTNVAQTDSLVADLTFTAVQSRNNMNYLCPEHKTVGQTAPNSLRLENETEVVGGPWTIINDNTFANLTWTGDGPTFGYSLTGQGLAPNTAYDLIYYADGWPGNNPGAFIGSATTDAGGNISMSGNPNLNTDLPELPDGNFAVGAKIWLVRTSDYNNGTLATGPMTAWNPANYLFEGNVYIRYNDTDHP